MYMVVSRWEIVPGKEKEFEERSRAVRETIQAQPGVKLVEGFRTEDGAAVAVIGYESRHAYDQVVNDVNGPFNKAVAEHRLEECSKWVWSERGEAMS